MQQKKQVISGLAKETTDVQISNSKITPSIAPLSSNEGANYVQSNQIL
jgi:hypothetical protein